MSRSHESSDVVSEIDTILSGQQAETRSVVTVVSASEPSELFSTYLVSPAYYVDTAELLLIKLVTAKGEPFYLIDPSKVARSLVCGSTEVFLAPYDAASACTDECDGLPALHLVSEADARQLFSQSLKKVCTRSWFSGLVFISSVGVQFFHFAADGTLLIGSVYRVASDREGHIEAREVRGAVTCDYPVPYFLVNHCVFAEGDRTVAIIESLTQANVELIDSLCRIEYIHLHKALKYPDVLESTLDAFMGSHSHHVRRLLQAQIHGAGTSDCDDAFIRRQRKGEIDTAVRLMMREVELVGELKKTLEELQYVEKALRQCPPAPEVKVEMPVDEQEPPPQVIGLAPLFDQIKEDMQHPSLNLETVDDAMLEPLLEADDDDLAASGSSGSQCSR